MNRPLVITDCDEVLLHMVGPFRDWLGEDQGIRFDMARENFARALTHVDSGDPVAEDEIWRLLNLFFDGQMHRQYPIPGSVAAMAALAEHADVVVLTNLKDHRNEARAKQLADLGIGVRVFTNQGPKGPALKAIIDEYRPSRAVFIDDLAVHHGSVSETSPEVFRLHFCGEPLLAPNIACAHKAGHAHARIDAWDHAVPWLLDRLTLNTEDLDDRR
jgi:FMN phosphatase YigB (HAD superfamily)